MATFDIVEGTDPRCWFAGKKSLAPRVLFVRNDFAGCLWEGTGKIGARSHFFSDRLRHAVITMHGIVVVDPDILDGTPVLSGTRFTVAQVFAEIADGDSLEELADRMDLDLAQLKTLFEGMSICLDRPYA